MSVDKLVDSTQLDSDLTSVANAIRTKGGTSAQLAFPAEFVSAIAAIPSGGGTTGLNYVRDVVSRTSTNQRIYIDREFDNFIFIAELKDFPPDTKSGNYTYLVMCTYLDDNFVGKQKVYAVLQDGTSVYAVKDTASSPSKFAVSSTTITCTTMDSNYSYTGDWIVLQIELPSSLGLYSLANAVTNANNAS